MNKGTVILIILLLLLNLNLNKLQAQNIESIGKKDPVKITGGVSTNHVFYTADDSLYTRDPYNYFFSGNLNFSLYGWSVPLSYTYSNQNSSFQQPFNQYSLHPNYKWATGHFGYNSMSFSPYTLSGHLFTGVGIDLAPPGKFKFSGMYGRLQKAVELNALDSLNTNQLPAFQRIGYGFKASYNHQGNFVDFILFKAKDDINSLPDFPLHTDSIPGDTIPTIYSGLDILPQENLVLSIGGGITLIKKLAITAELASSAITRDIRTEEEDLVNNIYAYTGSLFTQRTSSSFYTAFKGGVKYNLNAMSFGVGYERIDPGYQTLGAYYFNNDLENITLNTTARILKDKVNLAFNIGRQRDNLDNKKVSKMTRTVSSLNVGYAASQKLNFNASYSNFQSYTNMRPNFIDINRPTQYDNLDTLNFTQISQSFNLNTSYIIASNERNRQHLNVNLSVQVASDEQEGQTEYTGSKFYNLNTAYNYSIVPTNLSITTAFNANINDAEAIKSHTLGPTLAVNKTFFEKKLRGTFSTSFNKSFANGAGINQMLNFRLNNTYNIKKKHNFNLNMVLALRKSFGENAKNIKEFTTTFGYSYNF